MVHRRRVTVARARPRASSPRAKVSMSAQRAENRGSERARHQAVNCRRSRVQASRVRPRYPARNPASARRSESVNAGWTGTREVERVVAAIGHLLGQPGPRTQDLTLEPNRPKTGEAGPGAPIHILPADYAQLKRVVSASLAMRRSPNSGRGLSCKWQCCHSLVRRLCLFRGDPDRRHWGTQAEYAMSSLSLIHISEPTRLGM